MTILEKIENIKNQKDQYLLPENLKKDITLLGVTGTLEGGRGAVKLFNNQTQMQADTTAQEGDLAVVYRNDISTPQPGDSTSDLYFLDNVVFSNQIDTYYDGMIRSDNLFMRISLSPSYCYFEDWSGTIPAIYYSSNDGITYVREDQNESHYELEQPVILDLDEHILQFMQSNVNIFEGLYQYNSTARQDINKVQANTNCVYPNTSSTLVVDMTDIIFQFNQNLDTTQLVSGVSTQYIIGVINQVSNGKATSVSFYLATNGFGVIGSTEISHNGSLYQNYGASADTMRDYSIITVTQSSISYSTATTTHQLSRVNWALGPDVSNKYLICYALDSSYKITSLSDIRIAGITSDLVDIKPLKCLSKPSYFIAPTQLNSLLSNLYEGVTGYGKEGLITGDGSIREKFTIHDVLSSDYNVDTKTTGGISHYVASNIPADICKLTSGNKSIMRYTSTGIPTGGYPAGRCGNSKFVVEVNRTPQEIKGYNIQTGECLFTHTYSYNQPEYSTIGQYVSEEESWLAVKTYDSAGPSYGIRLYKITYSGIQYWNIPLPIFIGSGDNFVVVNGNVYLGISNRVQVSGTYYYDLNIYKVNLSNSSVSLIGQPRGSYRSTYMYVNVGFNPTSRIVWFHHNKMVVILNTANDSIISNSISHDDTSSSRLIMRGSDGNGYIISTEYSSGYSYYLYKITATSVTQSSLSVQNSTLFNQIFGKYPDRFDVTTKTISINHGQFKGSYYNATSNVGEYKDSSSYMINKNQVLQSQLMFGASKPPICDSELYISSSNGVMFVSEWINNVDLIETSMLQNALLKAGTNSLMSINEDYTYSFTDSLIDEILS